MRKLYLNPHVTVQNNKSGIILTKNGKSVKLNCDNKIFFLEIIEKLKIGYDFNLVENEYEQIFLKELERRKIIYVSRKDCEKNNDIYSEISLNLFDTLNVHDFFKEKKILYIASSEIMKFLKDFEYNKDVKKTDFIDSKLLVNESNLNTIIDDRYDLIVVVLKKREKKLHNLINEFSYITSSNTIFFSIEGYRLIMGPYYIPGQNACFECSRQYMQFNDCFDESIDNKLVLENHFISIALKWVYLEVLRAICDNISNHLMTNIITIDLLEASVKKKINLFAPNCRICDRGMN